MPNKSDVMLRFLLDEAAHRRVQQGITTLAQELAKVGVTMEDIEQASFGDEVAREIDRAAQATKTKLNPALKETKDAIKLARAEAAAMRRQVAADIDDIVVAQIGALRNVSGLIQGIGQSALAIGGALSGGIFLAAKNYIKDADQSDRLTQKWLASTNEIAKAQERIGRVSAQAVLPFLERAATISSKVASFVEQHPEIVQAAFNTGLFVAGFGALAIAVSKGIKFVADIKYLATIPIQLEAARMQDAAADKQLAAAQLRLKELGGGGPDNLPTSKGAGGLLGAALPVAGFVAANVGMSVALAKQLDSVQEMLVKKFGVIGVAVTQVVETSLLPFLPAIQPLRSIGRSIPQITEFIKKIFDVGEATEEAGKKAGRAIGRLQGSANEQEVAAAWQKWQAEDAQIVQEAAEERIKIIQAAENKIADITARAALRRTEINASANAARAGIIRDFTNQERQAEINRAKQRADIIASAGEEIRQIEERHQENIRKMTLEHGQQMSRLAGERDALGLIEEQERFDQSIAEAERETNQEIAQRNRQTALRLEQLAAEFAHERAQRLAKFQQDLADNEQHRQEQLKQAAAAAAEELKQAQLAKAQQLRELQDRLNAERRRKQEVFIAEIRDLDASLIRERGVKQTYYNVMLEDAQRFLIAYRSRLPTAGTTTGAVGGASPAHDYSGYAYSGLYHMAANGQRQFVMSGNATQAAERLVGGQLSEQALMRMAGGAKQPLTVNINLSEGMTLMQVKRMISTNKESLVSELAAALQGV